MLNFALSDNESWRFACLSGDFNPLHVDAIVARRLQFGGTICHGVHLTLKALDLVVSTGHLVPAEIASISVLFGGFVRTGSVVGIKVLREQGSNPVRIVAANGARAAFTAKLELADLSQEGGLAVGPQPIRANAYRQEAAICADFPTPSEIGSPMRGFPLQIDEELFRELFPSLAGVPQGLHLAADLMATTRIVGMLCPGLHSIYAELKLRRYQTDAMKAQPQMDYSIERADRRFRSVKIKIAGGSFMGTLGAFFRAPPVAQALLKDLQRLVEPTRFAHQSALVVGGSRGLGELVAKLLLAGGATVTLSYARGKTDAERIKEEAVSTGLQLGLLQIDVSQPLPEATANCLGALHPSHVYYFATPSIGKNTAPGWNAELFDAFCQMYVHGFAALVQQVARTQAVGESMKLLYPSTVFLDQSESGFAEYRAAKAAGESLCEDLARQYKMDVFKPRLPRLQTDQNGSFMGVEGADPIPVMLSLLDAMQVGLAKKQSAEGEPA